MTMPEKAALSGGQAGSGDRETGGGERAPVLSRDKAIPLYYQIETILRRRIVSGELAPGDILPGEQSLAQQYQVSRITVRQALAALERDGLITRKRAKGTFVSEKASPLESPKLTGSFEDLISMGIKTETKILDFGMVQVPVEITGQLQLTDGEEVLRVEKVRLADNRPFSYVLNYLPPQIGRRIHAEVLAGKPTLKVITDDLKIRLGEAVQKIEATIADSYVASLLNIRVGDPLLKIERVVYDRGGNAVEYVSALYRADRYFYTVRLQP